MNNCKSVSISGLICTQVEGHTGAHSATLQWPNYPTRCLQTALGYRCDREYLHSGNHTAVSDGNNPIHLTWYN